MTFKFTISRLITPFSKSFLNSARPSLLSVSKKSNLISGLRFSSTVDHLSKEQVEERVFNVLKAFDKVATTNPTFNPSSSFTTDLGLDSLDVVEVIMAVEEEFGIEIPDEAADSFKTPQEVIEYVHSKIHH